MSVVKMIKVISQMCQIIDFKKSAAFQYSCSWLFVLEPLDS
jgi:hypothetical protein